jgi:hypothetical protein
LSKVQQPSVKIYGIVFNRPAVEAAEGREAQAAITDGVDFVDLAIFDSIGEGPDTFSVTENYSQKILYAPKTITRGDKAGLSDYVRRENAKVYGLAPAAEVLPGYMKEEEEADSEDSDEARAAVQTAAKEDKE